MSDPLTDAANAISTISPKVRAFAQLAAARIIALESAVKPPPPPVSKFTQGYSAAEMQAALTAGNLVRVAADRLVAVSATVCRFEVRPGDVYSNWSGERSQFQLPQAQYQGGEGDTFNWTSSLLLDAGWRDATTYGDYRDSVLVFEFHHTGLTGSPPLSLHAYHGNLVARLAPSGDPAQSNNWRETTICPLTPGVPMTFKVEALLSSDPVKSRTVVSAGGRTVTLGTGCNLLTGFRNYVEWGIYRHNQPTVPFTQVLSFAPMVRL